MTDARAFRGYRPCISELDVMILRAEAACERYRLRATEKGYGPPVLRKRHKLLHTMEEALARLCARKNDALS